LLTQKFCYHSPFYRELWKLKASHGIELTRTLMCSWHDHLADTLHPLYKILGVKFRQTDYLKIDETPIRCLEPGNGKAATGYFWVYHHAEHGVLFDWHKSRANTCLDSVLIDQEAGQSINGYLTEKAIRPTKIAHKNWIFAGGEHSGWRSAVIYTFVEQIRRHGADPFAYFDWGFEKLMHNPPAEELESLLPVNWLKTRATESTPIDV
jgi:hypothetical protein